MAVYKDLESAIETTILEIEKGADIGEVASFAHKIINESYVPFMSGALKSSSRVAIQSQIAAEISWNTPYANRRYYENYKNPDKTEWFGQFESKNSEDLAKLIESKIDKNIT